MKKLVLHSTCKTRRSDISTKAGDTCEVVSTDPEIIAAVDKIDATLGDINTKLRDHLSPIERAAALDELDSGVIGSG